MSKILPLWNITLSALDHQVPPRIRVEGDCYDYSGLLEDQYGPPDDHEEDPRNILQPEPKDFDTSEYLEGIRGYFGRPPAVDLRSQHGNLQIIVKLANIHLTPEKPEYQGGSWHLEGQLNENM